MAPNPAALRIASWNVESLRAHHDQVIDWVDEHCPDVLCMQETRAGSRTFPRTDLQARGFMVVDYGGGDGTGGVAIASRPELSDVTLGIPGAVSPLDEPRSITATVADGAGAGLRVHTCYAPNGRKVGTRPHEVKLAWFALFSAWLEIDRDEHPDQLVIGDFNIAPTDIDVWEASRYRKRNLTSPRERHAFAALLADGELLDLVRQQFGSERVYTWWNRRSDFYESDRGWRLDHALATPSVAARVASVTIDRDERARDGSADHAPIVVELSPV